MSKLPSDLMPHEVLNVNVGVLGHVDSGKTSLVKALSTLLSTASLDKNPQSIARGITLDLGFSAFLLPLPDRLESQMAAAASAAQEIDASAPPAAPFRALQFTLVDCPGHASLIRTIIGGAQIIDMMILVVNVLKGIQTQTAECLVIGEICTKHLIVVLNKVDLIPEGERAARVAAAEKGIRSALKATKFANCPIVATAAAVGGEKVAAIAAQAKHLRDRAAAARDLANENNASSAGSVTMVAPASFSSSGSNAVTDPAASEPLPAVDATSSTTRSTPTEEVSTSTAATTSSALEPMTSFALVPNLGLNDLLNVINTIVELPSRREVGPFYFSIDHCFPIKGQGTVITGTVLSGTVKVNDMVEIPYLRETKKVKSMQMFHKNVKSARQGDRLGLCLQGLDSKLVERGVASSPGTVPALHGAIALVQRIRYFKGAIRSGAKVHVTIGHSTVLATVTFFGHSEIYGHRTSNAVTAVTAAGAANHQGSAGDASSAANADKGSSSSSSKGAKEGHNMKESTKEAVTSLAAASGAGDLPTDDLHFDWQNDYLWQDEMRRGRGHLNKRNQNDNDNDDDDEGSGVTDSEANSASESHHHTSSSSSSSLRPTAGTVDELVRGSGGPALPGLQWAMLEFETAVYTPLQGLLVASRLDTDVNTSNCRIAFFGKMVTRVQVPSDPPRLKTFKFKTRVGTIAKLGAAAFATTALAAEAALTGELPPSKKKSGIGMGTGGSGTKVSEVYGKDLFKKETDMKQFIGRKVVSEGGVAGTIDSAFGTSGKFKVVFKQAGGVAVKVGERLFLQFKRFTNDATKAMVQDAECLQLQPGWKDLRPSEEAIAASAADTSTSTAAPPRNGSSVNAKGSAKKKKAKKPSAASSSTEEQPLEGKSTGADSSEKAALQAPSSSTREAAATGTGGGSAVVSPSRAAGAAHAPLPPLPPLPPKELVLAREGKVLKVKDSGPVNGQGPWTVICEGLFRPEEDVRLFEGRPVRCLPQSEKTEGSESVVVGILVGPFGKGGKCKVEFSVEVPVSAQVKLE